MMNEDDSRRVSKEVKAKDSVCAKTERKRVEGAWTPSVANDNVITGIVIVEREARTRSGSCLK